MQLIPNALAQFIDSSGAPLASGSVGFYFPGTLNPKATYQDSAGTIANPNPVPLNSRGQASIWGSGVYRQIVKDASGVTIWDQITEDPNAGLTGDLTDAVFVAGTDFTPGTTTALTLPAGPGSIANTWIFFDAAYQDDAQATVSGTTLTFASPIPVGVGKVTVKIGTTVAVGTPVAGSVTDATVASGANIDSSKLSFLQAGAGAVRRTVQSKLRDVVNAMDFGAKGDGTTDDTAALQLFLTYCAANNLSGRIPAGTYIVSTPLTLQMSNSSGGINAKGVRPSIYGDGSGNTLLFYTGASPSPVLSVIGGGDYEDLITVKGFRISRSFVTPAGVGFLLQKTIHAVLEDLAFVGFNHGYELTDVNHIKLLKVFAQNNNFGFFAQQGAGGTTAPNLIEWDSCTFGGNTIAAGVSLIETVNTFRNCSFEENGNGTQPTLTLTYGGLTGTASAMFSGNYFEGNWGQYDIDITLLNGMPGGNLIVDGNVFDKISATQHVTNHIFIDASAMGAVSSPFNMQIRGNGFFSNGLAPDANAVLQAPGGSGYTGFRSNDILNDNTFSNPATQGPGIASSSLINGEAVANISSAGVVSNSFGVTGCAHSGTGQYVLTIPQLTSGAALISVTPNVSSTAQASAIISSATTVTVQMGSGAGAAADIGFFVRIKML